MSSQPAKRRRRITPHLWFDKEAKEAAEFYTSIFENSRVASVTTLRNTPEAEQCGWLKDKYGVSWQIVPSVMDDMMSMGTQEQIARVTAAFLKMKKLDIVGLENAYNG